AVIGATQRLLATLGLERIVCLRFTPVLPVEFRPRSGPGLELLDRGGGQCSRRALETFKRDVDARTGQFLYDIEHRSDYRVVALHAQTSHSRKRKRPYDLRRELQEVV